MTCIVNPDLCPSGAIPDSCTKKIKSLCSTSNYKNIGECLKNNKDALKDARCFDLDNLENCFMCNFLANTSNFNLSSVCAQSGLSQNSCENANFGQLFDPPLNCCKWTLPPLPPLPPDFPYGIRTAGIFWRIVFGGLFFMIVIGLIIWLILRKKSKKGGR
jgi:hypothetical protein